MNVFDCETALKTFDSETSLNIFYWETVYKAGIQETYVEILKIF